MISLLAGKPNPVMFPFESMEIKLKPVPGAKDSPESVTIAGQDLTNGLQYGKTAIAD